MEHTLHCNVLKCRKELGERALVTTCYHIFCGDCASSLGLATQNRDQPIACPACGTQLTNPDDAVVTSLRPSEDYKTSVLSGLSPNVIMDCASRALSFWAYQVTQEIIFQEHMSKTLRSKYTSLNVHLDKMVNDANAEIANCHNKLKNAESDRDELRKKYDELMQAYKEKNRLLLQTQELYDKVKRKAMLDQVQDAAEDAVESTLHLPPVNNNNDINDTGGDTHHQDYMPNRETFFGQPKSGLHENRRPLGPYIQHPPHIPASNITSWPRTIGAQGEHAKNINFTQCVLLTFEADVPLTPSSHRQRIGDPTGVGLSTIPGLVSSTPRGPRNLMTSRIPLSNVSSNSFRGAHSTGTRMSSGVKSGQPRGPSDMTAPYNNHPTGEHSENDPTRRQGGWAHRQQGF
ncbi:hypothetical protein F5Y17DRAFT_460501 [Xylariaceae sp. FL0594]|nr:hypothetical protein F5Y17DRAFT_460501 [Xylariaceae sp. FL0594]